MRNFRCGDRPAPWCISPLPSLSTSKSIQPPLLTARLYAATTAAIHPPLAPNLHTYTPTHSPTHF